MKIKSIILLLATLLSVPLVHGQSTAFTYQGRLTDNGIPANGNYDLQVGVHDQAGGGGPIAGPAFVSSVPVSNGLFTVTLDFGAGVFNGAPRWLQMGVRTNGSLGAFITLLPRQAITSTPYAIQAAGLAGTLPDAQLSANIARLGASNAFSGPVNFNPATGSPFTVNNNKRVANLNADLLDGKNATDLVAKVGDTMTGPLLLPNNGLAVGSNQLVLANGNVGIGTSNLGNYRLNVQPDEDIATGIHNIAGRIGNITFGYEADGVERTAGLIATGEGLPLTMGSFGVAGGFHRGLTMNGDNVGIGTTTPAYPFEVRREPPVDSWLAHYFNGPTSVAIAHGAGHGLEINTGSSAATDRFPLRIQGSTSSILAVRNDGNVGIGTTAPSAKLEVAGTVKAAHFVGDDGDFKGNVSMRTTYVVGVGSSDILTIIENGNSAVGARFTSEGANDVRLIFQKTVDGSVATQIGTKGDTYFNAYGGNVGIGTTTPSERLSVNGKTYIEGPLAGGVNATLTVRGNADASGGRLVHLYAPWGTEFNTDRYFMVGVDGTGNGKFYIRGDGAYVQSSSRELKTDIKAIAKPLDVLNALQGVYYKWKGASDSGQNAGFIAEDVAEVFPEASAADRKAVNYPAVIPLLVEGVKELDAKLTKLDKRTEHISTVDAENVALAAIQGLNLIVKEKEAEIDGLKKRLDQLEKIVSALPGVAK